MNRVNLQQISVNDIFWMGELSNEEYAGKMGEVARAAQFAVETGNNIYPTDPKFAQEKFPEMWERAEACRQQAYNEALERRQQEDEDWHNQIDDAEMLTECIDWEYIDSLLDLDPFGPRPRRYGNH